MNNTISNNAPNFAPAGTNANSGTSAPASRAAEGNGSLNQADQVKLTDSARALQNASKPNETVGIDSKRVDQVRQALASGNYKVDSQRIADKALALDQQLGGLDKA